LSLISHTVKSASTKISFDYFGGDELFGYTITASYKIDVSDAQYTTEDGDLLTAKDALEAAYETQKLVARIGGDEFTNAKITNLNFAESPLVGNTEASISIEQKSRLGDYENSVFVKHIPNPHLISSFSESFDFGRTSDGSSFSRKLSLEYSQDAGGNFLNDAKQFLSSFYHLNRPNLGYYSDGISENARFDGEGLRKKVSEDIDLINFKISLSEDFDTSFIENDYSRKEKESVSVGENGYLEKKITVEISANKEPLEKVVADAMAAVIDDLYGQNQAQFGKPISIEKGINKDGGKATLTLSFSADPKINGDNVFSYSVTKQKNGSYFNYNLSAEYSSDGRSRFEKLANAKEFWSSQIPYQKSKVTNLFSGDDANLIYENARDTSFDSEKSSVSDKVSYSTDPSFNGEYLDSGIAFLRKQVSLTNPVPRSSKIFSITDTLSDKVVVKTVDGVDLNTAGNGTITLDAAGSPHRGLFYSKNFLISFNPNELDEPNVFVNSDTTTLNIQNGSCQRVIAYDYY
jgi:hypothetical protein